MQGIHVGGMRSSPVITGTSDSTNEDSTIGDRHVTRGTADAARAYADNANAYATWSDDTQGVRGTRTEVHTTASGRMSKSFKRCSFSQNNPV
jgi:hypothetical protein